LRRSRSGASGNDQEATFCIFFCWIAGLRGLIGPTGLIGLTGIRGKAWQEIRVLIETHAHRRR
jgi:hypothetical protein